MSNYKNLDAVDIDLPLKAREQSGFLKKLQKSYLTNHKRIAQTYSLLHQCALVQLRAVLGDKKEKESAGTSYSSLSSPPVQQHKLKANWAIAMGLTFLLLWSVIAPLHGAVMASGIINADLHRKSISHLEGGVIKTIAVFEGQHVKAGELLLSLDPTRASAELKIIGNKLMAAILLRDRLLAEQGRQRGPAWSDIQHFDADPLLTDRLKSQQKALYESRQDQLNKQLSIYRRSLKQMVQQGQNLKTQLAMQNEQIELFADEIQGLSDLFDSGLIAKSRLRELQRELLAKQSNRSVVLSQQSQLEQRSAETVLKLDITQREWQSSVVADLQAAEENIALLLEQRKSASNVLERTHVLAPADGVVIDLRIHTVGSSIQRGQILLDMTPLNSPLIIHARVQPTDIDDIAEGQKTQVRFSSFSQRNTLPAEAIVRSVSNDLIQDAKTGEKYYLAQIDLGSKRNSAIQLVAGMPVEVMILTQKRSLFDYLTQPLADSFNRAMREA